MLKSNIISQFFNWTVFLYLLLICIMAFSGVITFGHGLGDLFFVLMTGSITLSYFILILYIGCIRSFKSRKEINYAVAIIFLIITSLLTYKFTLGSGPENSWKGNVFMEVKKNS